MIPCLCNSVILGDPKENECLLSRKTDAWNLMAKLCTGEAAPSIQFIFGPLMTKRTLRWAGQLGLEDKGYEEQLCLLREENSVANAAFEVCFKTPLCYTSLEARAISQAVSNSHTLLIAQCSG